MRNKCLMMLSWLSTSAPALKFQLISQKNKPTRQREGFRPEQASDHRRSEAVSNWRLPEVSGKWLIIRFRPATLCWISGIPARPITGVRYCRKSRARPIGLKTGMQIKVPVEPAAQKAPGNVKVEE